jgi:hypothetical protein
MSFDPFDFKNTMPSINEDSEFFPLMSSEDEAEMNNERYPILFLYFRCVIPCCFPVWLSLLPLAAINL